MKTVEALALCGGGAKGAYQIGVWRALEERKVLGSLRAISGTSIGGLNAILFALGDFDQAKKIWYTIRENIAFSVEKKTSLSLFSRSGLRGILKTLPLSDLKSSPIQIFVNVHNINRGCVENICLNHLSEEEIIHSLLATSAIPAVYESEIYHGERYVDGGITQLGNIPIEPLYECGFRDIVVVSLDNCFSYNAKSNIIGNRVSLAKRFPGARFSIISPVESLGNGSLGTFEFSPLFIRDFMIRGYQDARKQLARENVYTMRNNYSRINVQIRIQMERMFSSAEDIERFVTSTNFTNPNIEMKTFGGKSFYGDVVTMFGWRLQQHNFPGLKSHYRFLDPDDNRRAWVLNPDDIVRALDDYEAVSQFNSPLES